MKKLSKINLSNIQIFIDNMCEQTDKYNEALETLQKDATPENFDALKEIHGKLQNSIEDSCSYTQDLAEAAQEYYDERSERWMESERGDAYAEWISELEGAQVDDLDELPESFENLEVDELEEPYVDVSLLEDIPDQPEN